MQIFIITSLILLNIILWFVFFIKFKNLFSVDNEIEKARNQFQLLLNDINRNTLENINLIDMKIDELNSLVDTVDRRLNAIHTEEFFHSTKTDYLTQKNLSAYSSKVSKKTMPKEILNNESMQKEPLKKKSSSSNSKSSKISKAKNDVLLDVIDQNAAYEISLSNTASRKKQNELFNENAKQKKKSSQVHYVDSNGNGYGEVPLVSPKIFMAENPIQIKKSFNDQVNQLYNLGYTTEQIARELNKSTTEVQIVIDMLQ